MYVLVEFSISPPSPTKQPLIITPDNLPQSAEERLEFYTKITEVGEKEITVKISYNLEYEAQISSMKEVNVLIPVVKPFKIESRFLSTLLEDVHKCYVGEDFAVMQVVECVSPWALDIVNAAVSFVSTIFFRFLTLSLAVLLKELQLFEAGDCGFFLFLYILYPHKRFRKN